jgi:hypothetical protein
MPGSRRFSCGSPSGARPSPSKTRSLVSINRRNCLARGIFPREDELQKPKSTSRLVAHCKLDRAVTVRPDPVPKIVEVYRRARSIFQSPIRSGFGKPRSSRRRFSRAFASEVV